MAYKDNFKFYKKSIQDYGVSAQGVHWNSRYSQYRRFEIITKEISFDFKTSSFADVGCGFADYYTYILEKEFNDINYLGIDCEKEMIRISKDRFPNKTFLHSNALEDALPFVDYYICSGALNILNKNEVFKFIKNCFIHCNKAFIFNFLEKDSFNKVKKKEIITYINTLTKKSKIINKYLENDCTVIMYK